MLLYQRIKYQLFIRPVSGLQQLLRFVYLQKNSFRFEHLILIIIFLFSIPVNIRSQEKVRPRVGLVLSGGGAKGFAHIGVLKVLEEAGMPIDFIGGTSMGSIIGGLYAMGYSADSIQKLVEGQNWPTLLTDRLPRQYLSFEEKENDGKYFVPFPIIDGKFQLPPAVIAGQNFELLLSRLAWNANTTEDFSKLPIPFLCVATDLDNGSAFVFHNGSLVRSIRASMAIPTVFMPINVNGVTMVDGGIYNNFPVDEVQKMGAEIIIGVDVGFEPFKGANLNSMLRVIEQSVFTHTVEKNKEQRERCNIFLKPDLHNYHMMSFDNIDSIIVQGEKAARLQFGTIKALADSLNNLSAKTPVKMLPERKYIDIDNIKVEGNKNTPRTYILSKFNIEAPSKVDADEIEQGILRLNGTLLFKKVMYRIGNEDGKHVLILDVSERPGSMFSIGVNYNTDYRASIYLNTAWYNIFKPGSKLSLDALLGENPKIDATYFIFSGWNPSGKRPTAKGWRFDFGLNLYTCNYNLYQYNNLGDRISSFDYTDISAKVFAQTIFLNSYAWGIGVQNEFSSKKADINPFHNPGSKYKFFNIYSYLKFDTYNHSYYPTKGIQLNIEGKYLSDLYDNDIKPAIIIDGHYSIAATLSEKLSLITSIMGGITLGDTLPETYQFYTGGISTYYVKNAFQFIGQRLLEYNSKNLTLLRFDLQVELFRRNYIIARANAGQMASNTRELLSNGKSIFGYGIAYGYNSLIGPMEFNLMSSSQHKLLAYLNIGFWF